MKVATWNVNGMRARTAQFLEWVQAEEPDVVCLQEIKANPSQLAAELCDLDGYHCYWHGAGAYSGVSLLVRQATVGIEPIYAHPALDRETRVVEARLGDLCITSIYVPNGGKDYDAKLRFLEELREYAGERLQETDQLILCGDMNVTRSEQDLHPRERNTKLVGQRSDERALFEAVLDAGVVDLARHLHPDDDSIFTWWAPWRDHRKRNIGWRIDYQLVSPALAERARDCWVEREVGTSDHAPVVADFNL
jgi:exodeoxyribonuclease III